MLTVDFDRLRPEPGMRVLDLGCGNGRHTFEAARRGLGVVSCDLDLGALTNTVTMTGAMALAGQVGAGGWTRCAAGNALALPFADSSFDAVVASEVLEHIVDDSSALAEIARVLAPGGTLAVTVPRWWPEKICWALSREYHEAKGGHVRIYRTEDLIRRVEGAGFQVFGSHHAHALHSPYWWFKCAFGVSNENAALPRLYHRFLVWDIEARPVVTRVAEKALNPLLGKSLVVYATKTSNAGVSASAA
jgi:SAM-dependent methyltransferase